MAGARQRRARINHGIHSAAREGRNQRRLTTDYTEHTEENTDSAAGERPACPLKRTPTERKWHLRKPACHNAISRSVGMPRCNRGIQPAVTMLPHSDVLSLSV